MDGAEVSMSSEELAKGEKRRLLRDRQYAARYAAEQLANLAALILPAVLQTLQSDMDVAPNIALDLAQKLIDSAIERCPIPQE